MTPTRTHHPIVTGSFLAVALLLLLVAPASSASSDQNWPQWRGPNANGVAPDANPPIEWSESKNVQWKVELPGLGSSTPVVWGDRVFVTTAIDSGVRGKPAAGATEEASASGQRPGAGGGTPDTLYRFAVLAYDRATGRLLFDRTAREGQPHEGTHPDGTYASPSPITDGEMLYAFFGSNGLYAYDLDGTLVWKKDLGDMKTRLGFGEGSSPAISGDLLFINWDHEGDSFIVALDKKTGEERWRTARAEATSWATPIVVEHNGKAQVIVSATARIRSYDASTGALLWESSGQTLNAIPSPVHKDGVVYITSGFRGNSLMAIRLDGAKGDISGSENILWTLDRDTPYVPSPLLYGDIFYMLKSNKGLLTAVDIKTGNILYGPERLSNVRNVYASPVGAANRVYLVGREGDAIVIAAGPKLEILAENVLDDGFDASPAIVDNQIFLRGRKHLYCIAAD